MIRSAMIPARSRHDANTPASRIIVVLFAALCAGCAAREKREPDRDAPPPARAAPGGTSRDRTPPAQKDQTKPADPGKPAAGADWHCFRGGPGLRGIAPGTLPARPVRRWQLKLPGGIRGQVAIAGGRVFAGCDDGKLRAVDLRTGRVAWQFTAGAALSAAPLVLGAAVYAADDDGAVYAVRAENGRGIWKYATDGQVAGGATWFREDGGATRLLVGSYDNFLHCIDADTGTAAWKSRADNYVNGSAAVADAGIVYGSCDGFLRIVDRSGNVRARAELGNYIPKSPAVAGDAAYAATADGKLYRVALPAGTVAWMFAAGDDEEFFSAPAVGDDLVVMAGRSGKLHCVRRKTGTAAGTPFRAGGGIDSSPVLAGDRAVFGCADGRIYIVAVPAGKKTWSYRAGGEITAAPAVAGSRIVVGTTEGRLLCFGEE